MNILQTTFIAAVSLITAICMTPPLDAKEWNCRNKDMEITCGNDRCGVQPDGTFTPMSIHLDEAGPVEIPMLIDGQWVDAKNGSSIPGGKIQMPKPSVL